MIEDNNQSPHAELQTILPRLSFATPRGSGRPVFNSEDEADKFVTFLKNDGHDDVVVQPVWGINHEALDQTEVVAWTVTTDRA